MNSKMREYIRTDSPYWCDRIIRNIQEHSRYETATVEERIAFCKFAIQALEYDVLSDAVQNALWSELTADEWTDLLDRDPFPDYIFASQRKSGQIISLQNKMVIAYPHCRNKLFNAIIDVMHRGFQNKRKPELHGLYYPELNLVMLVDGHHHGAVGQITHSDMTAKVDIIALSPAFEAVQTDGVWWYYQENSTTKQMPVYDIRFAYMYRIAQLIHSLETTTIK